MEIYYELMMKNGLCFLAGTNHEGICEFSIDGNEFVIHTFTDRNGDFLTFSFSVDSTGYEPEDGRYQTDLQEEFSVLSVRKVDEKRKKYLKSINRKSNEIANGGAAKRKFNYRLTHRTPNFCARQGSVDTPNGWIYA